MSASILTQATITSQLVLCFNLGPCNSSLTWQPAQPHPSVSQVLSLLCSAFSTHPHSDPYVTMGLGCFFLTSFPVAQLSPTYQVSYSLGMGCFLFWVLLSGDYPGTSLPLFRSLVRRSARITLFKTSQSPQIFTTIYIKYLSCLLSVSPLRM